ncbi:MAG: hypothetical protein H7281_10090 [Bacteriovorax sp.]|nr:hypothetical protein [Bacteriovorax sp.]
MKKNLALIFIPFLLIPAVSLAFVKKEMNEKESLDRYYQNLFIGEKKTNNYSGPIDPRSNFSEENGELWLLDDQFSSHYLNNQIQADALDLHSFWFKKIIEKSTCPDATLGENIDYIRYLYRLLTISYLFESLKINHKVTAELGADKNICALSFEEVFDKCKPQSDDMKKFHERVYGKFVNEISKINVPAFNKKELTSWLENFQHSTALTIDPVHARLHDWCHSQKKNCRNLSVDEVKKALGTICNDDRDLIQNLCSEKDNLFGASYAEKATELIQTSNAFNLINHSGMGEDCLRRYVKIFSPKEIRYGVLSRQFPLIYSQLIRENSRYLQGELFLPGALKEFDIKGLSDFLTALKPPKVEPVIKVLPKPKPKPKIVVAKTKPVEVARPEPVQMEIVPPPKPKISEFEKAVLELDEKKLESLSINMESFRDDFEFSQQMIADLATPIKKFQTRAALNDMKSYDNLGSAEAPVGLIFLKYLIDTENHQGLYNIVTVLGDKFYVTNDIEKKDRPVYIELRNDASSKNHWQIILMKKTTTKTKK